MKSLFQHTVALLAIAAINMLFATQSQADPLANEVPKFSQQPMINTAILNSSGTVGFYQGHDEISTIYGPGNIATQPLYQGSFMADDFSDTVSTPVVHITWWGSYHGAATAPQPPVQQFLITFDLDNPSVNGQPSYPKAPLQTEIVNKAALSPGSGTFTETQVGGPDSNGDLIYKYNAELANPFPEQANVVYWLNIAALVNVPAGTTVPPPAGTTNWGWHNRDYTIQDPLASPIVLPGEHNEGTPNNPIWHFQDDAVQGQLAFNPAGTSINQQIIQQNPLPQNYIDLADGPVGIGAHSKDLAFVLYTQVSVPEPATCGLMAIGLAGVFAIRRRSRVA